MDNHSGLHLPQLLELHPPDFGIKLENGNGSLNLEQSLDFKEDAIKTDFNSSEIDVNCLKAESPQKVKPSKAKKKAKVQPDFVTSILDQENDNVIDFFENIDPMLAWALLKSKILPHVGSFDLVTEKAKMKMQTWEPETVIKTILDEMESLIGEIIKMIQSCCDVFQSPENHTNAIQLSHGLSLQLFGSNQTLITTKSLEEIPLLYKEKMFKSQEMKPLDLVKAELNVQDANNELTEKVLQELGLNDDDFMDNGLANDDDLDDDDDDDVKCEEASQLELNGNNAKANASNANDNKTETEDDKKNQIKSGSTKRRAPKTCEKCHKTYNTQTQFRIHQRDAWRCPGKPEPKWLRIVKGKDYYCLHPDCSADGINGPLFPRRNKYWLHLREKHWNREVFAFDCKYCQEKFPFYDMLRQHIKQYHEKAHVCKYCGSSFSRRRDLTLHERRHTGEKPYRCDKCDFRCNTAGSLRMHTVRRHEDPNLHRTHVCEICGKSFHAAYILKEHILTHSDIKRYTCDICGRQLRNDSCYRRHMMNIHGQKITCDHCNKDFSSPMGVKIHKRDAHGIMY